MIAAKRATPAEELEFLCNFSVTDCVAHVSELSPGTDICDSDDVDTLIESLRRTPDLTGVLLDGLASVRRPGILGDHVVFYNRTEEEMLAHLEAVERHDHVHWMFKMLMQDVDELLGKFRKALPKAKIVYNVDTDDLHSTCERMLRVIVQSAKAKIALSQKSLNARCDELRKELEGTGALKKSVLERNLAVLKSRHQKHIRARETSRAKSVKKDIAQLDKDIRLLKSRDELKAKFELFKKKKNQALAKRTERQLRRKQDAISAREQGLEKALIIAVAEWDTLEDEKGAGKQRKVLDGQIKKLESLIDGIKERITRLVAKTSQLAQEATNYREPETSPIYQRRVAEHVQKLYKRFDELGEKHGIEIVKQPGLIVFGTMAIDYAHDRGRTWHPMPGRAKRLAESYHGYMEDYRENVAKTLEEMDAPVRDIDVIMESGHHGVFFARWQRLNLTAQDIRMQHVNTFHTGKSDNVKHVVYLVGMPFEPQDQISKYLNRGKPARTRAGKPIASASHPVFIRNTQGSVAGVTLVRKHNHGLVSVEAIEYDQYRTKEVLKPYKAVASQDDSDNHFMAAEFDPLGTLGTLAMNDVLMRNPLEFYGTKVYIGGKFNVGDLVEPGTRAWKEAHKFHRNVMADVKKVAKRLVGTNTDELMSVMSTLILWLNDMMGGSNENMKIAGRVGGWYLKKQFLNVLKSPKRLRDPLVHVEGNHWANSVRDMGFREFDVFEQWLLDLQALPEDFPELGCDPLPSLKIQAGGEPQYFQEDDGDHDKVVHLGGYSVSRQAVVEEYGVGHDGELLVQKPYRVGLSHEPNNVENKAESQLADVHKDGHIHESTLRAIKRWDNKVRFLDQKGCTTGVTATDLIIGGIPRTAGVDLCVYTQPGRYMKMTIPMQHMRRIGFVWLLLEAKRLIDERRRSLRKKAPAGRKALPKKASAKRLVAKKKRAVQKRRVIGKKVKGGRHGKKRV